MMSHSYANIVQGASTSNRSSTAPWNQCDDKILEPSKEKNFQDKIFSGNVIDNHSHLLYPHNNDHPGLILIAKKLIGPENYAPWSRSMQIVLNARNKFIFINGTFKKPEVLKNINSLEQGNKSVEVYFHKLKGLLDEYVVLEPSVICVCGAHKTQNERDQNMKLLQFLMGLHDSNATMRGSLPLAANHVSADVSSSQVSQMQQQLNQFTQMMYLYVGSDKCISSPEEQLVTMVVTSLNLVHSVPFKNIRLIDSGATDHMCCSSDFMINLKSLSKPAADGGGLGQGKHEDHPPEHPVEEVPKEASEDEEVVGPDGGALFPVRR
ncbi:hypothetical protein AgCh_020749 [Apium graveolens]